MLKGNLPGLGLVDLDISDEPFTVPGIQPLLLGSNLRCIAIYRLSLGGNVQHNNEGFILEKR
jgi:hypothetical protein